MKIFILLFAILITLYGAKIDEFANKLDYSRDYNSALEIAKKQNKVLMLVVVADYCPWCKKFERKTLNSTSVKTFVNKNFVPVIIEKHIDIDKYPKEYASAPIPTVYFIDPKTQKSIYRSISYIKKKDFTYNMQEALRLFQEKSK